MNVVSGNVEILELLNYIYGDNFVLPIELKMKLKLLIHKSNNRFIYHNDIYLLSNDIYTYISWFINTLHDEQFTRLWRKYIDTSIYVLDADEWKKYTK